MGIHGPTGAWGGVSTVSREWRARTIAGSVATLLVICTGLVGCAESATETPATIEPASVGAPAVETTAPAPPETPVVSPNEGLPIVTPDKGTPDRTALMDAARAATGATQQFLVWQLLAQGDVAVGDIQEFFGEDSTPGARWLVVWERSDDGWKAVYHIPYLDASADPVRDSSDALTDSLVAAIEFVVPAEIPADARTAATRAQSTPSQSGWAGPYPVFAPSRLPEGMQFESAEIGDGVTLLYYADAAGRGISVAMGWGDCDIWSYELVSSGANWGSDDGTYARATDTEDKSCIHRHAEAAAEVGGTGLSEGMLRAVAMSMQLVTP